MPDKTNKTVVAEPFIASDELVMPGISRSSVLATAPLTASGSLVQPGITAVLNRVTSADVMTATALAGNARVFEDRIITADIFLSTAIFNSAGVRISVPGGPMLATVTMPTGIGSIYYTGRNNVTIPYIFKQIPSKYVRYLMNKSTAKSIPIYKEVK
jgi:hypothetical protein